MKGSIQDVQVNVKPSKQLIDFISSLNTDEPVPANVLRIREANGIKTLSTEVFSEYIPKNVLTNKQRDILKKLCKNNDFDQLYGTTTKFIDKPTDDKDDIETIGSEANETESGKDSDESILNNSAKQNKKHKDEITALLSINDLRWVERVLAKRRAAQDGDEYLHELIAGSELVLPENQIIPRNPVLEARCVKLREQQQDREYRKMTKDVDATRQYLPEDTIAYQMKSINRQLVAVFQFVVSVITGFVFGFIGLEYILGDLDFGFRLFMGIMCALIIALAEIYFLAKKLNEYDEIPEDVKMPARDPKLHKD